MRTAVSDQYSTVLGAIKSSRPQNYMELIEGIMDQSEKKYHNSSYAFSPVPISSLIDDLFIEGLVKKMVDAYVLTSTGKLFLFHASRPLKAKSKLRSVARSGKPSKAVRKSAHI